MTFLALVVLLTIHNNALGQERDDTFSIGNTTDATRVFQLHEVVLIECRRVLELRQEGKLQDGAIEVRNAARLLVRLRPTDSEAILLLASNLTLHPEPYTGPHWLNGYVAVEALIEIGGPKVAREILTYMREPRSTKELLLCAQVLYRNDDLPITFERMRLAGERARQDADLEQPEVFLRNLAQVKEWLSDPGFAEDQRYLPR
jgi:hypothetical protein